MMKKMPIVSSSKPSGKVILNNKLLFSTAPPLDFSGGASYFYCLFPHTIRPSTSSRLGMEAEAPGREMAMAAAVEA